MRRATVAMLVLCTLAACRDPAPAALEALRAVRVARVTSAADDARLEYAAEIRARYETRLGFRVGGKLVERRVDVGARVREGEVLARLDATDYALAVASAQAQVDSVEAERALAAEDLARFRALRAKNFISQAEFDRRAAGLRTAEARLEAARAAHRQAVNQAAYAVLRAPAAGVVTQLEAEAGQVVAAGQTVLRLARPDEVEVAFAVPEAQLEAVRTVSAYEVHATALPGRVLRATLREVSPVADPVTRTFQLRARLADAGVPLALGMSARVVVAPATNGTRLLVPLAALHSRDTAPAVFVVGEGDTVRLTRVRTGGVRGERMVIESGLEPGMRVVSAGASLLRDGERVRVVDATPPR